jgi:hypothetical protein
MQKKAPEINPSQQLLFVHPEELEPAIVYGPPESYVGLEFRSEHLNNALLAFGKRNQRLGFDYASNARPHERSIWSRYARQTPQVQEGARANVDRFTEEGKREFWKATGYSALRSAGLAPNHEIDAGAKKEWRDFSTRLADTHNRKERDQYKRKLHKIAKVARQARTSNLQSKAA